jgi:hypothetical protein
MARILWYIAFASFFSQLIGCVTILDYPHSKENALLYLKNETSLQLSMDSYLNSDDCSGGIYKLTNFDGVKSLEVGTVKLMPNKKQSFRFTLWGFIPNGSVKECSIIVAFTPKSNETYSFSVSDSGKECSVRQTAGSKIPDLERKKFNQPFFSSNGPWCE